MSATYTTAHGTTRSLCHWVRPGIEPTSSWIMVGFVNCWATMGTPPRHISMKLTKIKDKEKILKATRENKQHTKEPPLGYKLIFQQKLCRPEGSGRICLKLWKGKSHNQEYTTQQGFCSDSKRKSKALPASKA